MTRSSTLTIHVIVTIALTFVFAISAAVRDANGQQPRDKKQAALKTGSSFQKALELPTSLAWQEVPLRGGLRNLSETNSIAIFLDRRVDPGHRTNFSAQNKPLGFILYKIADQLDLGICFEADTVYIGPRDAVDRLPTLLATQKSKIAGFEAKTRVKLAKSKSLFWNRLAEPRELVQTLAANSDCEVSNADLVPHDVWNRGRLPAARIDQQLTILLNGFDMMFIISKDAKQLKLISIPMTGKPQVTYSIPKESRSSLKQLQQEFPEATYAERARKLTLKGTFEQHARIYHVLNPPPGESVNQSLKGNEKKVYTVAMSEQAGSVLTSLARALDRELKYDPSLKLVLSRNVTIDAKQAPIEELLKQALDPLELEFRLDDKNLTILRKE